MTAKSNYVNKGKTDYIVYGDVGQYYITSMNNTDTLTTVVLHVPAESISESPGQPEWTSHTIVGRTSPLQSYVSNGARTISFTSKFIDDMVSENLLSIRNKLGSMLYPKYTSTVTRPTKVFCRLGSITIKGIMTQCTFRWSGPIRNNHHIILECDITIEESVDTPYDTSDILKNVWGK